jgi:hypothetical protein
MKREVQQLRINGRHVLDDEREIEQVVEAREIGRASFQKT